MNFETFFNQIEKSELTVDLGRLSNYSHRLLDNEALFQLPLISLIILVMAKDRRKFLVAEVGQLVGESLESSMFGFKGSAQHIGWSANLRVRTVKAMIFLENSRLIEIHHRKGRMEITDLGREVINRAITKDDNLSYNLLQIARSYRNICVSKQLDMELE